jgi:PAS domain-containing protein
LWGSPLEIFVDGAVPIWLEELQGAGGDGATLEIALADAVGMVVPVLVGYSVLNVPDDQLICLTFTDLSVKKAEEREVARLGMAQMEAQESLRESEQRYRTIVDNADEGIWIADLDGVITFANPAVARILGVALSMTW